MGNTHFIRFPYPIFRTTTNDKIYGLNKQIKQLLLSCGAYGFPETLEVTYVKGPIHLFHLHSIQLGQIQFNLAKQYTVNPQSYMCGYIIIRPKFMANEMCLPMKFSGCPNDQPPHLTFMQCYFVNACKLPTPSRSLFGALPPPPPIPIEVLTNLISNLSFRHK